MKLWNYKEDKKRITCFSSIAFQIFIRQHSNFSYKVFGNICWGRGLKKHHLPIVCRGYLSPPFQIIPSPLLWFLPFKKIFNPPYSILFFQTLNLVILIALAKSRSMRGASHQPVLMVSCLTISHVCLSVYLVEGLVIVFLVLLKQEVAAILGNGCEVQGQNYVAWLQGSKMLVGGWWGGKVGKVEG